MLILVTITIPPLANFLKLDLYMKEWTIEQVKSELRHRSNINFGGQVSYSLENLEAIVFDPRFPKRTNDTDIEKIRDLVLSRKR